MNCMQYFHTKHFWWRKAKQRTALKWKIVHFNYLYAILPRKSFLMARGKAEGSFLIENLTFYLFICNAYMQTLLMARGEAEGSFPLENSTSKLIIRNTSMQNPFDGARRSRGQLSHGKLNFLLIFLHWKLNL